MSKLHWIAPFSIALLLGLNIALPLLTNKDAIQLLTELKHNINNVVALADNNTDNFWYEPPKEPYQITPIYEINTTRFWPQFLQDATWSMYKNNTGQWEDCSDSLELYYIQLNSERQKLHINFTAPSTSYYKLSLTINRTIDSWNYSDNSFTLNYTKNSLPYTVTYDFNDIRLINNLNLSWQVIDNKLIFNITTNRTINQGLKVHLDPEYTVTPYYDTYMLSEVGPTMARTSNGSLYVVYNYKGSGQNTRKVWVANSSDEGVTWNTNVVFNRTWITCQTPVIVADSADILHIVFSGNFSGSNMNKTVYINNTGGTWNNIENISSGFNATTLNQSKPSICIDRNDKPHVIWRCYTGTYFYIRYSNRTSTSWSNPENITAPFVRSNYSQNVFINSSDNVFIISLEQGVDSTVWNPYILERNSSTSVYHISLDPNPKTQITANFYPGACLDDYETLHVFWINTTLYSGSWNYSNFSNGKKLPYPISIDGRWSTAGGIFSRIISNANTDLFLFNAIIRTNVTYVNKSYDTNTFYPVQNYTNYLATRTSATLDTMYGYYPNISGVRPSRPKTGYSFIYRNVSILSYVASTDLTWDGGTTPSNTAPEQSYPNPANKTFNVSRYSLPPTVNITVEDDDGDTMNITWYSNSSGSWVIFGKNNSIVNPGSYDQIALNFTQPSTRYYWSVNLTDGVDWTNRTYWFETYNYTYQSPSVWNGTLYNQSHWLTISTWNGTLWNQSHWLPITTWNGTLYNQSHWNIITQWNGTLYNQSHWLLISQWNGTLYNSSHWLINTQWNGTVWNSSHWLTVSNWNGTIFNSSLATAWKTVDTWNGTLYNSSHWLTVASWNGTLYNQSHWLSTTVWNGTLYNQSHWLSVSVWNGTLWNQSHWLTVTTWNGTLFNASHWLTISSWNGTLYNTSVWEEIANWNGTVFNSSFKSWQNVTNWNGTIYNQSYWTVITDWNGTVFNGTIRAWNTESSWNGCIYNGTGSTGKYVDPVPYIVIGGLMGILIFYMLSKRKKKRRRY